VVKRLFKAKFRRETPSRGLTLHDVLISFAHQKAADPRDHVYGLLGLVTNWGSVPLYPDYASTTAEVLPAQPQL
jgi:hypothetical protein